MESAISLVGKTVDWWYVLGGVGVDMVRIEAIARASEGDR